MSNVGISKDFAETIQELQVGMDFPATEVKASSRFQTTKDGKNYGGWIVDLKGSNVSTIIGYSEAKNLDIRKDGGDVWLLKEPLKVARENKKLRLA